MIDSAVRSLWEYDVQVVPVLLALALFELPNALRRHHALFYVPIYFTVFPLRELNRDLSIYLGEDRWIADEAEEEEAAEGLRTRIILRSILSMALAAVIIPAWSGFAGSFFLTPATLVQFLVALVAWKLIGIAHAIRDFPIHARGGSRNRALLALIYAGYLGVAVQMIKTAYYWALPSVSTRNWLRLAADISDLVFGKALAQGIILAALTALLTSLIADRRIRRDNLREYAARGTEEWQRRGE